MTQLPPLPPGPNQTALELIFAIKGLAQAVEFMHSDLRRLLESEGRDRDHELERLRDLLAAHKEAVSNLPNAIVDKFEKVVDKLEEQVDERVDGVLDDVRKSLNEVRQKLWYYLKDKEKQQVQEETTNAVVRAITENERDVTGKIEISKQGELRLQAKFDWKSLKSLIMVGKWAGLGVAGLGGITWLVNFIRHLF